jgi:hypothetical protein
MSRLEKRRRAFLDVDLALQRIDRRGGTLPATYSAARDALEKCIRVDECKSWADKALALKSYAKQAQDDEMHKMAARIQCRAIRRCGDLLKEILRPAEGGRPPTKNRVGTDPVSRTEAATEAGLSERQRKTALRVASVPKEDFERQIESDDPPTVTELAEQGRWSRAVHEEIRKHMEKVIVERPEFPLASAFGWALGSAMTACRGLVLDA